MKVKKKLMYKGNALFELVNPEKICRSLLFRAGEMDFKLGAHRED